MRFLLRWFIFALAILITDYLLPGIQVDGLFASFVTAIILGLLNAVIRPVLLVLTLPVNVMTLGLLTFVINAFMILLTDWIVPGFEVANFWWALLFSLVLAVISFILNQIIAEAE